MCIEGSGMKSRCYLQALTTAPEVKRQGSGAYFVAMIGRVLVSRMNSPRNCSLKPKPYTCAWSPEVQPGMSETAHCRLPASDHL